MSIIILVLIIIAAVAIEEKIYERHWYKGLRVKIGFSNDKAVEGGETELYEIVEYAGRLPLPWLSVKFQASKELMLPNTANVKVTDYYYREDVFAIHPGERITRRLPVTCSRRGVHRVHSVDLISTDMLMCGRLVANRGGSTSIVVYPRTVDLEQLSYNARRVLGDYITKRNLVEDPFIFKGLRDYVEGDSPKSVNWRASAKWDRLAVNQYESTTSLCAAIWLNADGETNRLDEPLMEEGIRLAATVAGQLIGGGVPVSLCSNGRDYATGGETFVSAGCSAQHYDTINAALARIDLSKEVRYMHHALADMRSTSDSEELIIIISADVSERLIEKARELEEMGRKVLWILPARLDDRRGFEQLDCLSDSYVWRVGIDR